MLKIKNMKNNKYLPIKIVQKRKEIDESFTEGGGGKLPTWMQEIPHEERAEMFISTLKDVENELNERANRNNFIPAAVELTLDKRTIAKSHRSFLREMIDVNRKNNFIGFQDEASIVIKIDDTNDLRLIQKNVSNVGKHIHGLSSIIETKIFEPKINIEDNNILKIKLLNFLDYDLNKSTHRAFLKMCKELQIEVETIQYTSDLVIYKTKYDEEAFAELQEFEAISSIEDMPVFNVSIVSEVKSDTERVEIETPKEDESYPIVGLLDSGVRLNENLGPWVLGDTFTSYVDSDKDLGHGSAVASILIYGDKLEGKRYTDLKGCYIYDAAIVPNKKLLPSITEFDLISNITDAIKSKPEIKIWNLCIGWSVEISPFKISDFGAALDFLQDELNIIICTSVGNCKNFEINKQRGKIQVSSDSVRAISVGSIAHLEGSSDIAKVNESSPFSRVGEGPFNLVKPELVHFGGNAGIGENGKITYSGVKTIDLNGEISSKAGTSFSTPRITSIVAGLDNELVDDFDPLLLKALVIHSAKYPSIEIEPKDRLKQMGFGIPLPMKEILYNAENEITLVIRDTIEKGHFIEILDFPYPSDMVQDDYYYGEITVTLVSSPELIQSQGEEYCQSNIDVAFGTYNDKVRREGRTIRNSEGKDSGSKNLLNPILYSKREIRKNKGFNDERLLKNFYQKFQPVKKWVVNLDEITESNKVRHTEYPKRWYLKVEGLFRDHIENIKDNIGTDFCLIITIRDTKNNTSVYENVTTKLEEFNFIQNDIKVKSEIKLKS